MKDLTGLIRESEWKLKNDGAEWWAGSKNEVNGTNSEPGGQDSEFSPKFGF